MKNLHFFVDKFKKKAYNTNDLKSPPVIQIVGQGMSSLVLAGRLDTLQNSETPVKYVWVAGVEKINPHTLTKMAGIYNIFSRIRAHFPCALSPVYIKIGEFHDSRSDVTSLST